MSAVSAATATATAPPTSTATAVAGGGPFPATVPFGHPVQVEVTDPAALAVVRQLVRRHLSAVESAVDGRRPDAEVHRLAAAQGRPVEVSRLLLRHVGLALQVASDTGGLLDPTVDPTVGPAALPGAGPTSGWRSVVVDGSTVTVPAGTSLDLRATAIAAALDDVALVGTQLTGAGVLVRCGSRVATAGPAPEGGWRVEMGDALRVLGDDQGLCVIDSGSRVLDPATGVAAQRVWHSVAVVAGSCLLASSAAVAAVVSGTSAPTLLDGRPLLAVLESTDGRRTRAGSLAPLGTAAA